MHGHRRTTTTVLAMSERVEERARTTATHLSQGDGLGSNRGSKSVSNIVCSNSESSEKSPEGPHDHNPQKLIRCLGHEDPLFDDTTRERHHVCHMAAQLAAVDASGASGACCSTGTREQAAVLLQLSVWRAGCCVVVRESGERMMKRRRGGMNLSVCLVQKWSKLEYFVLYTVGRTCNTIKKMYVTWYGRIDV